MLRHFLARRFLTTDAKPLRIFYGSQTGTARGFAQGLAGEAARLKLNTEVIDLKTFTPSMIDPSKTCVFLLAVYGKGLPTDNATEFFKWLQHTHSASAALQHRAPPFKGVEFAVFGLGNKRTHAENFCVVGRKVDEWLGELGATRQCPRVDGDDSDDIESQFDTWQVDLVKTLTGQCPVNAAEMTTGSGSGSDTTTTADATPAGTTCLSEKSFAVVCRDDGTASARTLEDLLPSFRGTLYDVNTISRKVLVATNLTPQSSRATCELRLDLSTGGGAYTTGDHAVVYPSHCPDIVEAYVQAVVAPGCAPPGWADWVYQRGPQLPLSLWPDAPPLTFRQILMYCVELSLAPSPSAIRLLRTLATDPADSDRLAFYSDRNNYVTHVMGAYRRVLDLLVECPSVRLDASTLLAILPRLRPRFYSISSSSLVNPSECHLTFRALQLIPRPPHDARDTRLGTCTGWLAGLNAGDHVPLCLYPSRFHLPNDIATPVVMVAGGAGIAPFKAFLEERVRRHELQPTHTSGPAELYYGIRDNTEFVYEDLVGAALAATQITVLELSTDPVRVAQRIAANAPRLWRHIAAGGKVYVCGGASGFGPSVSRAFVDDVFSKAGGLDPPAAAQYLKNMLESDRYLEDLSD